MWLSANSVSAVSLGGPCKAIEFNVPFLKGLEKAIQGFFVQGFELAIRILPVRTFPCWGRH
jgi:hypothetical protein